MKIPQNEERRKAICNIDGCDKPARGRGWCTAHWYRWRHHGNPLAGGTAWGVSLQWLHDHVAFPGDECLFWPFGRKAMSRGKVRVDGRMRPSSRIMCELRHGPPLHQSMKLLIPVEMAIVDA